MKLNNKKYQANEPKDLNKRTNEVFVSSVLLQGFVENHIDWIVEGLEEGIQHNMIPIGLVPLLSLLYRHDRYEGKNEMFKPDEYEEVNIGSTKDPKMIEMEKRVSGIKRTSENIIRKYGEMIAHSHDGLKVNKEYMTQHTIPLKECIKPLKHKLRQKWVPLVRKELQKSCEEKITIPAKKSTWPCNLGIMQGRINDTINPGKKMSFPINGKALKMFYQVNI